MTPPEAADTVSMTYDAVARAAQLARLRFHHAGQRRQAGVQTEPLKTRPDFGPSPVDAFRRDNGGGCDTIFYSVAFLCGFNTPSLRLKMSNAYLPFFNSARGIPLQAAPAGLARR
jgi:hypothetical protein